MLTRLEPKATPPGWDSSPIAGLPLPPSIYTISLLGCKEALSSYLCIDQRWKAITPARAQTPGLLSLESSSPTPPPPSLAYVLSDNSGPCRSHANICIIYFLPFHNSVPSNGEHHVGRKVHWNNICYSIQVPNH